MGGVRIYVLTQLMNSARISSWLWPSIESWKARHWGNTDLSVTTIDFNESEFSFPATFYRIKSYQHLCYTLKVWELTTATTPAGLTILVNSLQKG